MEKYKTTINNKMYAIHLYRLDNGTPIISAYVRRELDDGTYVFAHLAHNARFVRNKLFSKFSREIKAHLAGSPHDPR